MATPKDILEEAKLVDSLISSLDKSDSALDQLLAKEAESRLAAYKKGELKSISLDEMFI